ncbi:ATPase, partial [Bacillus thuringiensis]
LMNFKEGESAVIRVIKRQDNNRKRIRPRPIYNTGETALKYRWEYLGVEFDTDKSILDIDIDSLHDDVNPKSLIVDFLGERKSEPEQEDLPPVETSQPVEEPTMMGIDEEIPEEAFQQEDSPFDSLSIENWKGKTVNEFFESDLAVLKLVDKFFLAQLGKSLDEVENQEMGEFYSEFQMLAHNDHIDKSVYQAVENKINRILRDLEEKEQVTS